MLFASLEMPNCHFHRRSITKADSVHRHPAHHLEACLSRGRGGVPPTFSEALHYSWLSSLTHPKTDETKSRQSIPWPTRDTNSATRIQHRLEHVLKTLTDAILQFDQKSHHSVKALVRWTTGKGLPDRLPKLSLTTITARFSFWPW